VDEVEALAWLVITQTSTIRRGQMFPLGKLRNDIGRGADVPIYINDDKIGRVHATVKYERDPAGSARFVLHDLASTNGTFVNGQKVLSPAPLQDGDRIKLGDTELTFKKV
jgi:pSer/pThr/pTyr-binding forkhead associated (FHA) protein